MAAAMRCERCEGTGREQTLLGDGTGVLLRVCRQCGGSGCVAPVLRMPEDVPSFHWPLVILAAGLGVVAVCIAAAPFLRDGPYFGTLLMVVAVALAAAILGIRLLIAFGC